jgi:hypothetical protein
MEDCGDMKSDVSYENKTVNLGRSSAIIRYTSAILSALLLLTKGL